MAGGRFPWHASLTLAGAVAGGCLLVAPVDDLPPPSATGASGGIAGTGGGGPGGASGTMDQGGAAAGGEPNGGKGGAPSKGGRGGAGGNGGSSGSGVSAGEGGMMGGSGGCTSNAECVEKLGGSEPYRCRVEDGRCVVLKTDECPLAYGDFADPNALYFGSFAGLNPENPGANSVVYAERLALDEINAVGGGVPGGPDGAPRPLVMVVCNNDTSMNPDMIQVGMAHLADDVGVQALLATLKPADLLSAFEDQLEDDIFFLSPVALTSLLADKNYPDRGLIWNLLGQPQDFAPAYAKLLAELDTYLRTERALDSNAKLKVALVSTNDVFDQELETFVYSRLMWNGKDAAGNGLDGNYLAVDLELEKLDLQNAANEIIDFAPDIVISAGSDPVTQPDGIVQLVEEGWAAAGVGQRPYFMLSPYNAGDLSVIRALIPVLKRNVDANTDRRYLGISAAAAIDLSLQNEYATRLRQRFDDAIVDTGNYYDAVYLLSYAAAGAASPLTGPRLAAAMPRLLTGDAYGVGPDDIESVYSALAEPEATIELDGTLGPPDFDPKSGVRRATPSVFCFEATQSSTTLLADVLRYDPTLDEFNGVYPCMPNFHAE